MPRTPRANSCVGISIASTVSSSVATRHLDPLTRIGDALVVMTLDAQVLCAGGRCGEGTLAETHAVLGPLAQSHAVTVVAEAVGQVLLQSAASGDVHDLHSAADPEQRHSRSSAALVRAISNWSRSTFVFLVSG